MADGERDRLKRLYRLADTLIAEFDKADIPEAARILALDLAQYQARYRELPADECVSPAAVDGLAPGLAKTVADGMENLVGVLGSLPGHEQDDDAVRQQGAFLRLTGVTTYACISEGRTQPARNTHCTSGLLSGRGLLLGTAGEKKRNQEKIG